MARVERFQFLTPKKNKKNWISSFMEFFFSKKLKNDFFGEKKTIKKTHMARLEPFELQGPLHFQSAQVGAE